MGVDLREVLSIYELKMTLEMLLVDLRRPNVDLRWCTSIYGVSEELLLGLRASLSIYDDLYVDLRRLLCVGLRKSPCRFTHDACRFTAERNN